MQGAGSRVHGIGLRDLVPVRDLLADNVGRNSGAEQLAARLSLEGKRLAPAWVGLGAPESGGLGPNVAGSGLGASKVGKPGSGGRGGGGGFGASEGRGGGRGGGGGLRQPLVSGTGAWGLERMVLGGSGLCGRG